MNRSRPMTISAVLAALALVLAACGAAGEASPSATESEPPESEAAATEAAATEPADSEAAEEQVRLESSVFDPRELTVQVGSTVIFTNGDSFEHTVTEGTNGEAVDDPIVDERIEQDQTVRVTFDEAGTYEITCKVHPSMQMTITVEG